MRWQPYWTGRLVYYEHHDTAWSAVKRERLVMRWLRDWKIELVEKSNPTWRELFNDVLVEFGHEPEK